MEMHLKGFAHNPRAMTNSNIVNTATQMCEEIVLYFCHIYTVMALKLRFSSAI